MDCFDSLCQKISANVGEDKFKSEAYLREVLNLNDQTYPNHILQAHIATTSGFNSGEIKLALKLRILAGGMYCWLRRVAPMLIRSFTMSLRNGFFMIAR